MVSTLCKAEVLIKGQEFDSPHLHGAKPPG